MAKKSKIILKITNKMQQFEPFKIPNLPLPSRTLEKTVAKQPGDFSHDDSDLSEVLQSRPQG